MLLKRICAGTLVLALAFGWAPSALAVSDEERSAARAAAGQGADAYDASKWAEAVELFSRAEALVHSPIHLLYIGRAQLKLGQWVKAYEAFNKIKREGVPADAAPALKRAVDDAAKELAQLEPQLPYVATKVKNPSGDVQVSIDGAKVPPLLVGLLRPLDPGQHQFQATNGQLTSDVVTLEVKPGTKHTVELELKAAASGAAPGPVPVEGASPVADAPVAETSDAAPTTGSGGGMRIAGYGALGVGVAGLAVGTVFMLKASATQGEADDLCPQQPCDPAKKSAIDRKDKDAASQRTLGIVGFAVGGVAVATGITLLVLSSGNKSSSAKLEPRIVPFIGYRSLGVSGSF